MTTSMALEWGSCPCGGKYENRWVTVRMTVRGNPMELTDVPQGLCPNCGGRVYKAEVLERIEGVMKAETRDHHLNRRMV